MWQDYIIAAVTWLFVIFTIPLVKQVFKEKMMLTSITTLPTSFGNYILMIIWLTFPEPMWVSFFSSLCIATLWLMMAIGSRKNYKSRQMR